MRARQRKDSCCPGRLQPRANARLALTVAEHAETGVDAHAHVVVDDIPELEVVVVGQCDRATTLQASTWLCSEASEVG